jgi:hypothetical protein
MILKILLTIFCIIGSVIFKFLIEDVVKDADKFNRKLSPVECDGTLVNVPKVKREFMWRKRIYCILMCCCIVITIILSHSILQDFNLMK